MIIDFELLKSEIEAACVQCFTSLMSQYKDEIICGYGLYSDAGAMSISPAINTQQHLADLIHSDPDDAVYYKWSVGEWKYEGEGGHSFRQICNMLQQNASNITAPASFDEFRRSVYETCVASLESLIKNEFFPRKSDQDVIVFSIPDADNPLDEIKWIERLNDKALSKEFSEWITNL